jgi:hypothetical protein
LEGLTEVISFLFYKHISVCVFFIWLPSATYFFSTEKVSKKGRPSSAGVADFSQIPLVGTKNKVAY